jgi:hypothetical protein
MMRSIAFVAAASWLLIAGCGGSSFEEQQAARQTEYQRKRSEIQEELAAFAQRNSAKPVDLFDVMHSTDNFTAQLQDQLEGQTIAFRSGLADIYRLPNEQYQVLLGNPRSGGNIAILTAQRALAEEMLKVKSADRSEYLIAAYVDRVTPVHLEVNSCSDHDCSELELRSDLRSVAHRISGRVVAAERAKQTWARSRRATAAQ